MKNQDKKTILDNENIKLINENNIKKFVLIYESVYKNNDLTSDELALILKLASKAPNYRPTKNNLIKSLHITEYRLLKATKGLQQKGYLKILNNGKNGSVWILDQEPQPYEKYTNNKIEQITHDLCYGILSIPQLYEMINQKIISYYEYNKIIENLNQTLKNANEEYER